MILYEQVVIVVKYIVESKICTIFATVSYVLS